MGVALCVRLGDGGAIVAISGEVDVCTEAPLQQALLRIIRERSARLMLDLSGVSFMDCAGLRALLATQRRASCAAVHAPDRGVGGGPADHRIDRRAGGLGHGAEHHGSFRPILLKTHGPDARHGRERPPAFRTWANAA
jgi:anti-anti-sigma factor